MQQVIPVLQFTPKYKIILLSYIPTKSPIVHIGDRIKEERLRQAIKQGELAKLADIAQQSLSQAEKTGKISRQTVKKIAKVLNVSVGWLEYGEKSSQGELISREPLRRIPVIDWHDIGNKGLQAVNENTEVVLVCDNTLSNQTFALQIKDDSMSPECTPGTFVVIDPELTPVHEDLVIVDLGSDKTPIMREYLVDGPSISLNAFNPRYSKFTLTDDMKILGVVHSSIKKRKK